MVQVSITDITLSEVSQTQKSKVSYDSFYMKREQTKLCYGGKKIRTVMASGGDGSKTDSEEILGNLLG